MNPLKELSVQDKDCVYLAGLLLHVAECLDQATDSQLMDAADFLNSHGMTVSQQYKLGILAFALRDWVAYRNEADLNPKTDDGEDIPF